MLPPSAADYIKSQNWSDLPVIIVASGESAVRTDLTRARHTHRFIVVNNSWSLAPWADILYAHDFRWWRDHIGHTSFPGIKICGNTHHGYLPEWGLIRASVKTGQRAMIFDTPGLFGHGGNSGYWALNLAAQLRARRIILVGFDMGGKHWHADHPSRNPLPSSFPRWIRAFDESAPLLAHRGITVINTSMNSALECFTKQSFEEAIECPYHHQN